MKGRLICGFLVLTGLAGCSGSSRHRRISDNHSGTGLDSGDKPLAVQGGHRRRRDPAQSAEEACILAAAKERYVAICADFEAAIVDARSEGANASPDLAVLQQHSRRAAEALALVVRLLRGTPWPREVQPAARALAASAEAAAIPWRRSARARTVRAWREMPLGNLDGMAPMRAALGLPPDPHVQEPPAVRPDPSTVPAGDPSTGQNEAAQRGGADQSR